MGWVTLIVVIALVVAVVAVAGLLAWARREIGGQPSMDVLDKAHEAFIAIDSDGAVTAWNAAAETTFGWSRAEAVGRELAEMVVPEDMRSAYREGVDRARESGTGPLIGPRAEIIALHRDGTEIPIEAAISPVRQHGGGYGFQGFVRDLTERKLLEMQGRQLQAAAEHSARLDALTSLPNRRAWDEELDRELARSRRVHRTPCVAVIDLDHFREFAAIHGHRAADRALHRAAAAWKLAMRATDFIARYDGQQFAVLLPDCDLAAATAVIERMRHATPEGQTASAGIAQWNRYEAREALIDRADLALFEAKRDGHDRCVVAA